MGVARGRVGEGADEVGDPLELLMWRRSSTSSASERTISVSTNGVGPNDRRAQRLTGSQPALVGLLRDVADGARAASIPVGVCGESASDPLFALVLVGVGVTSLSMSAPSLPTVRASLAAHSLDDCRKLAEMALISAGPREARNFVAEASRVPIS
jgi:phosphoenolpyruvate-protein phosphotransferase (PTS system enzyme I)